MRYLLQIVFVLTATYSSAQIRTNLYANAGINRIGVLYGFGVKQSFGQHNIHLGMRFYEPDIVFEKDFPGFDLGYQYTFRADKKMRINCGVMTSVFYEYKGSTALWLFDPKLVLAATWDLTDRMDLNVLGGIGPAVNIIETSYYIDKNKFTYLNYELSLGIAYRLGNSPSN